MNRAKPARTISWSSAMRMRMIGCCMSAVSPWGKPSRSPLRT
jgi:hypothetical protein